MDVYNCDFVGQRVDIVYMGENFFILSGLSLSVSWEHLDPKPSYCFSQATQQKFSGLRAVQFLRECYQKEGLLSLWRGNSATMARIIPYAAIQFTAHEQYKRLLKVDAQNTE